MTWPLTTLGQNFHTMYAIVARTAIKKRRCAPLFLRYPRKTRGMGESTPGSALVNSDFIIFGMVKNVLSNLLPKLWLGMEGYRIIDPTSCLFAWFYFLHGIRSVHRSHCLFLWDLLRSYMQSCILSRNTAISQIPLWGSPTWTSSEAYGSTAFFLTQFWMNTWP